MKYKFTFPVEVKADLANAMAIEKQNFEAKANRGLMVLERKLVERMAKFGLKVDLDLAARWDYEFVSDTQMNLEVFTYLDYIVSNLQMLAAMSDGLLAKLKVDRGRLAKWQIQSSSHNSRLRRALAAYEKAEPRLKIEEMGK